MPSSNDRFSAGNHGLTGTEETYKMPEEWQKKYPDTWVTTVDGQQVMTNHRVGLGRQ